MLLQARPDILEEKKRIDGGLTRPLVNKRYAFGELEAPYDTHPDAISNSGYSGNANIQKIPWLLKKAQIARLENPRTLTELGIANQIRGVHQKAIGNFKKALAIDANFIPAYRPLFNSLVALGKAEEAKKCLTDLAGLLSDDPETQHELILFKLLVDGDSADIKHKLISLMKANPNNAYIINSVGFYYLNFGNDLDKATSYFLKANELDKKYAHPINNLGVCYQKNGLIDKAIKTFNKAANIDRTYVQARENLANAYIFANQFDLALATIRQALSDNIILTDYWQHQEGWLLIQLGQVKQAAIWYEQRLQIEPDNPFLFNNLGFCYEAIGDNSSAEVSYSNSLKIAENEIRIQQPRIDARLLLPFYNLGRIFVRRGNIKEIERIGHSLTTMREEDSRGWYFLGAAALRKNSYLEAEKNFLKAIKFEPSFLDSYVDLSFIYVSIREEYNSAINLIEAVMADNEITGILLNNYLYALIQFGNLDKAELLLQTAPQISKEIRATKGLLMIKQGKLDEAKTLYDEAINSLSSPSKEIAKQNWLYESAKYLIDNGNTVEGISRLRQAQKLNESYMTKKINKLLEVNESY